MFGCTNLKEHGTDDLVARNQQYDDAQIIYCDN